MNSTPNSMTRDAVWRASYRDSRYMRMLSQPELNRRWKHLLLNFLNLRGPQVAIGPIPIAEGGPIWLEKLTHFLEEMRLRHGNYPAGFSRDMVHSESEPFPDWTSDLAKKAAAKVASLNYARGEVLVKFGKRVHMEALYETGAVRIQPASYFGNKSGLNIACRDDDEHSMTISLALSRDDIVAVVANPRDVQPDAPEQRVDLRVDFSTDYWVYCLTNSVQPRLFVDFDADACVVIRNHAAFQKLVTLAGADPALARTKMYAGNANYVDPLLPPKQISPTMFVPLVKHFGYTYQDEYRFCWVPSENKKSLSYVDVELGSLTEIAELVTL